VQAQGTASTEADSGAAASRAAETAGVTTERIDLWQRIRKGFSIPDLQNERVRHYERYYAGKPEYVQRMAARGSRYLFHIVEEVEKRGLPMELALLPFAESAFNPQALSSAKASGMWQFMPATGRDFDLRQNLFRDDRRDVLASTRAALDYLQRLYRLMGDWHLALAAYNWGQGNVLRAVAANRGQGKPTGFEHLAMPDETRNYVPKLQAIKNFVLSPQALGLDLPPLENQPYFRSVDIDRDIDVAKAAHMAGLELDEFKALNPQMNKPVILAAATAQVLLPHDNAERFEAALSKARNSLASWTAWVAPRTLKPAEAARQVGMSEADLREVNRIPERMLVKAGSTLLVPRSSHSLIDVASHVADNAAIMLTPEARPVRRVAFRAGRKGETVAAVARRYGLAPAAVAGWNKVSLTGQFKAGQTVVVMLPDANARQADNRRQATSPARAPTRPSAATATAPNSAKSAARNQARSTRTAATGPVKATPAQSQAAARAKTSAVPSTASDRTSTKTRARKGGAAGERGGNHTSKAPRA
jgi:membrane-bound lytic murein transglycosylase D